MAVKSFAFYEIKQSSQGKEKLPESQKLWDSQARGIRFTLGISLIKNQDK
jgi:hypothetical protein